MSKDPDLQRISYYLRIDNVLPKYPSVETYDNVHLVYEAI